MISLNVRWQADAVMAKLKTLREDVVDQAAQAALNKTADKARTEMTRQIAAEFALKASEVRARIDVVRASKKLGGLKAILRALESGSRKGRSLNLIHFLTNASTRVRGGKGRKQLTFRIKRGGPLKQIPGAFIGNQGRTVFQRVGDKRLPIRAVQTIDVPQMFNTRRINARVIDLILEQFPIEFERAARLYTDRFNARG